jgi:hypothetical protein
LVKQLAIRLNPQAGKSLVIPRKRESSVFINKAFGFVSALRSAFLFSWIPAFAGMT